MARSARRTAVIVLGMILVVGACGIVGMAFVQSTWGHAILGDRPISDETRAYIDTVQEVLKDRDIAPQAVTWLDTALHPQTNPSAVRTYLLLTQDALEATTDPELVKAARRLRAIAQMIRSGFDAERRPRWSTPFAERTQQG